MMSFASFDVLTTLNPYLVSNVIFVLFVLFSIVLPAIKKQSKIIPSVERLYAQKIILIIEKIFYGVVVGPNTLKKNISGTLLILLPVLMFVLLSNILGLVPCVFSLTALPQTTIALSLWVVVAITATSLKANGVNFFSQFTPFGSPLLLAVFLVLIETLSYLIKIVSLGVRLAANITAGHLLLSILSSFFVKISVNNNLSFTLKIFGLMSIFIVSSLVFILELCVALIQSYVFCLLSALYISEQSF